MTPEQFAKFFKQEKSKADAWFAALDVVKQSAPFVAEFVRLFPAAKVSYRYFTSTPEPGFDLEVDLHDRYELTMQLPVHFNADGRKVVGYGEPSFYLREVGRQEGRQTWYTGDWKFGPKEWSKIVDGGGDFSVIGCAMKTNQPVAGFMQRRNQP